MDSPQNTEVTRQRGNKMPVCLEICADSVQCVRAAVKAGAQRIQLCADLASGGTTPSRGLIVLARQVIDELKSPAQLMVLIRPRLGSFIYSKDELEVMGNDIVISRLSGADGIAIGCLRLNKDGEREVHVPAFNQLLLEVERKPWREDSNGSVTFNRAIDDCHDIRAAMAQVVKFSGRLDRILTSGGSWTAYEGLYMLQELSRWIKFLSPDGAVTIMPGSGITPETIGEIVTRTGCRQVQANAAEMAPIGDEKAVGPMFWVPRQPITKKYLVKCLLIALEHIA